MEVNLFLPKEPIFDNDEFTIYGETGFLPYLDMILELLLDTKKRSMLFFGIDNFRKVEIHLYDKRENLLNYIRQYYEPNSYVMGNFMGGCANMVIDLSKPEKIKNNIKSLCHELVHLIYMERVQENQNDRVVWLDEGLAQLLSNQYEELKDESLFKTFIIKNILDNKIIPPLSFLENHGDKYGYFYDKETNKYNGYHLSYLLVRYLSETIDSNNFQKIIRNKLLIDSLGANILNDAVNYFVSKYKMDINSKSK
jgi:hypothetical protein